MFSKYSFKVKAAGTAIAVAAIVSSAAAVYANHSWGLYHWGRTSNPFALKLGDNVSTAWDAYLSEASLDWSASSVLDTEVVAGNAGIPKRCSATSGRVEVCSAKYGYNGWLGVASIWASNNHIVQGTVKVNDSYFTTPTYNKPEWRRLVMCQEIGHEFGLDHQDENFDNPNLGSCMDYTNDPLTNQHPNAHDYEQLETIYNSHLDTTSTVGQTVLGSGGVNAADAAEWGQSVREDGKGRNSLYVRDLGNGEKVFTFILWAE